MPQPTASDVHVNVPLTALSVAYIQKQENFIADKVFPIVGVQNQSNRYNVYSRADFFRDEAKVRPPSTESAGGGYSLDNTPTYSAQVVAYHKDIDDDVRANSDSVLNPDRDAMQFVTQKCLIRRERDFVTKFLGTSIWGKDITGVASAPTTNQVLQWNDPASDPVGDVETYKALIALTGYEPNKLTIGRYVFNALKNHPDILDRIKYGGGPGNPAVVTVQALAAVFGVEQVLIANAAYNTAAEGATAAYSFIVGKVALLSYAPPAPSLMEASAGYTFAWTGRVGANAYGVRVNTLRMDPIKSDRVEAEMGYDQKVVAADLGVYFTTIVA